MPALELAAPDIARWRSGNTGIDYVWSLDSGRPGPHALLCAVIHGNELCGAIVLDELLASGLRPARGRLSVAFANPEALLAFDPVDPGAARCLDEDLNRVWDASVLDGPRRSRELARARQLRPLIDRVDLLLDLHSMSLNHAPLILTGLAAKNVALARRVGAPALLVRDAGHAAGRRLRDYGGFSDPASPKCALLVECGPHWQAKTVAVARETVWRFLAAADLLDPAEAKARLVPAPPQRLVGVTHTITVETGAFRFLAPYRSAATVEAAGTLIALDGDREIRTPYDDCVLIMPAQRFRPGQTAVRLARDEADEADEGGG